MNIPLITKSEADVSSNSSWSVISESEDIISEEDKILERDSDRNQDVKETDENFFDICENNGHAFTEESENEDNNTGFICFDQISNSNKPTQKTPKKVKSKTKKPKKVRRKEKAESLSLLSIAASVLTITGLTFLCMLFPQNFEKEAIQNIQTTYMDAIASKNASAENFLNKTSEIYDVVNKADFFKKMKDTLNENDYFLKEEICPVDDMNDVDDFNFDRYRVNFVPPSTLEPSEDEMLPQPEPSTSYQQVQNKTLGLIKNVKRILMDPNLQIFVCTILQDICLIKLVNQLNKQQAEKSTDNNETFPEKIGVPGSKKKKGTKVGNLKNNKVVKKLNKQATSTKKNFTEKTFVPALNDSIKSSEVEGLNNRTIAKLHSKSEKPNGKSECQRRFEELDDKWETAGHIHRQKIQEIRENFKNEIFHIKEHEKEYSLKRQRIQLLREKYIDRLKADREKYLYKLQKLREERQTIMKWLCQQKHNELALKDASVGNYAVLLPDTYNFQQKLLLLKNSENESRVSLPTTPTASFPKLGAVKNSKFIKFQSIPNIPQQEVTKLNTNTTMESLKAKKDKYLEKVKSYYEKKSNYLQKKALLNKEESNDVDFTSKAAETIGEALIEDIISHMVVNISEPGKQLEENSSNSSVETVKEINVPKSVNIFPNISNASDLGTFRNQNEVGIIKQKIKLIVKKKPKKRDLYDIAFDGKSKKVKQDDMMKWDTEKKEKLRKLQHQTLTKQDPQKAFKEKIIIKGHM